MKPFLSLSKGLIYGVAECLTIKESVDFTASFINFGIAQNRPELIIAGLIATAIPPAFVVGLILHVALTEMSTARGQSSSK